jgi:hypothetical protein
LEDNNKSSEENWKPYLASYEVLSAGDISRNEDDRKEMLGLLQKVWVYSIRTGQGWDSPSSDSVCTNMLEGWLAVPVAKGLVQFPFRSGARSLQGVLSIYLRPSRWRVDYGWEITHTSNGVSRHGFDRLAISRRILLCILATTTSVSALQ